VSPDREMSPNGHLSLKDAYLAMYYFIDAYWKRGGRRDGSINLLCHAIGPSVDDQDNTRFETSDPAAWDDWLDAVKAARSKGFRRTCRGVSGAKSELGFSSKAR